MSDTEPSSLPDTEEDALTRVAERYTVRVASAVFDRIEKPDDPVAHQYLPRAEELITGPDENADPVGDEPHSPVKGIVHRYPDRVLLMPVSACAVYCRFCFRREKVGQGRQALTQRELDRALSYIREHKEIYEVILSGGDPLILSPRRLDPIMDALEAIEHVQVLRVHSRVPVADPDRITDSLCAALTRKKALYVSVHVNHVQEIGPAAEEAFARLRRADCVLVSQTVLLKGVNDNEKALEDLFRRLVALRIKPYYLHHPDLAPGTGHFRLPVSTGQALVRNLRGKLSGLCQPTYMLDIPGGHGKVPLTPAYIRTAADGRCILTDPGGNEHLYPPGQAGRSSLSSTLS